MSVITRGRALYSISITGKALEYAGAESVLYNGPMSQAADMASESAQRSGAGDFSSAALDHLDALYGYAMTLTRAQADAEDLVQETYLRAARAFGQLSPNSNLKGWLFVVMRNAWLNQARHVRSGPRFVELDDGEEISAYRSNDPANNPYLLYVSKLERNEIRSAIEHLPGRYREIIVLRDIEGFSYQEIATMLGCPAGTVMSRLCRAREKLRSILGDWRKPAQAV